MLSNLVDNAIRYTPQGGIINLQVKKIDSSGVLIIEDNGPGISKQDREKVFDRFVRLSSTESDGSGIGLTIVTKILAFHQAQIELDTPKEHSGLIVRVIFDFLS